MTKKKTSPSRRRTPKRKPKPAPASTPAPNLGTAAKSGLDPAELVFALSYLENGFNATRAYATSHPEASPGTCRVEGSKCLTKPDIRAFLNERLEDAWKPLQMGGEQALARLARIASADIRDLYDENGKLLEPHLWPDTIAPCVKSVKDGPYGLTVTLESQVGALRVVLEQTGKLKTLPQSVDALADALRATLKDNGVEA